MKEESNNNIPEVFIVNKKTNEVIQGAENKELDVFYNPINGKVEIGTYDETKLSEKENLDHLNYCIDLSLQTNDKKWFMELVELKNQMTIGRNSK
jgi:hypothetical protein